MREYASKIERNKEQEQLSLKIIEEKMCFVMRDNECVLDSVVWKNPCELDYCRDDTEHSIEFIISLIRDKELRERVRYYEENKRFLRTKPAKKMKMIWTISSSLKKGNDDFRQESTN